MNLKIRIAAMQCLVICSLFAQFDQEDEIPLMRPDEQELVAKQSADFNAALEPIVSRASKSSVRIWGKQSKPLLLALGTVIGNGEEVLTKWSEIMNFTDSLQVQTGENQSFQAKVKGVYFEDDLAILELGAGGEVSEGELRSASNRLPAAQFEKTDLSLGKFLIAARPDAKAAAFGVVSVLERNLRETSQAHLGIMVDRTFRGRGIKIAQVTPKYGAAEAGLLLGDVILKVNKRSISGLEELKNSLSDKSPGDTVTLVIESAGKEREVEVVLSNRPVLGQFAGNRLNEMERMGGEPNRVRDGFSRAVQSDMRISANQVGGPVVDLSGKIVGISMARADRTRTYIMSSNALTQLLTQPYDSPEAALAKSAYQKEQLAQQQRTIVPKLRAMPKPKDPERLRRHLSDVERLVERMSRELEDLGVK